MFGGLFGSKNSQSPQPPNNQIVVVGPVCGAAQYEPRLVVSTFCKRCGVHLKMDKKRVIASDVSKAGGNPEAMAPKRAEAPVQQPATPPPARSVVPGPRPTTGPLTPMTSSGAPTRSAVPILGAAAVTGPDEDEAHLGLGAMMQAAVSRVSSPEPEQATLPGLEAPAPEQPAPVEPAAPAEVAQAPVDEIQIPDEPEAYEPNGTSAGSVPIAVQELMQSSINVAANPGTLQKMRDQGFYRSHHFKEAECFECGNKFKVGRSSRSANCPSCSAYISMEDVELNMPSTQAIKTRGDVLIRKRGQVTAAHLFARDLRCFGLISANTHCSGDAIFKTTGTIIGEVRCRKFIVEKGSEIEFMNEVHAEEIEINAPVKGHFFSKGKLSILASGAVDGSVTGRSINIEPGGELNGSMNIVRSAS